MLLFADHVDTRLFRMLALDRSPWLSFRFERRPLLLRSDVDASAATHSRIPGARWGLTPTPRAATTPPPSPAAWATPAAWTHTLAQHPTAIACPQATAPPAYPQTTAHTAPPRWSPSGPRWRSSSAPTPSYAAASATAVRQCRNLPAARPAQRGPARLPPSPRTPQPRARSPPGPRSLGVWMWVMGRTTRSSSRLRACPSCAVRRRCRPLVRLPGTPREPCRPWAPCKGRRTRPVWSATWAATLRRCARE